MCVCVMQVKGMLVLFVREGEGFSVEGCRCVLGEHGGTILLLVACRGLWMSFGCRSCSYMQHFTTPLARQLQVFNCLF